MNLTDPSGLLSNSTIAKMFGNDNFKEVLANFEITGRWGLLKLLQDAKPGDKLQAGSPKLGRKNSYDDIVGNPRQGETIKTFTCNENQSSMQLAMMRIEQGLSNNAQGASIGHRRLDYYLYYLNGKGPSGVPAPAYTCHTSIDRFARDEH